MQSGSGDAKQKGGLRSVAQAALAGRRLRYGIASRGYRQPPLTSALTKPARSAAVSGAPDGAAMSAQML